MSDYDKSFHSSDISKISIRYRYIVSYRIAGRNIEIFDISRYQISLYHFAEFSFIYSFWPRFDSLSPGISIQICLRLYACCWLAVPATSVSSERLFSRAGHIISDRRSSLTAAHTEQLSKNLID